MKIKRISKSSIKIFIASFFLTAFFMASLLAFIVAEKNSLKTGVREIKSPLALYTSEEKITFIVNDREFKLSLEPIRDALSSKGFGALLLVVFSL